LRNSCVGSFVAIVAWNIYYFVKNTLKISFFSEVFPTLVVSLNHLTWVAVEKGKHFVFL